jgi:transposase
MPDTTQKLKVRLSAGQRRELDSVCRRQSVAAAKVRRARVLLMSDETHPEGRRRDWEIAEAVGLSERQVVRIRQQFVRSGVGVAVLERQPRPSVPGKLDGAAEAQLVTLCCSSAPDGRDHWTLQLLCDELARLKVVESVCPETVRKCLKKMNSSPGEPSGSASRRPTAPGSWRGWKMSSTSTGKRTTRGTR